MKKKLFFENSQGNRLVGILSDPTSEKAIPLIIMCHGFSASKESNTYIQLEATLNKKGISTFRFDFYGHGESEGKFEDITISEAVDDTLNAINYFQKQGYTKIGLFGSSFGGIASIIAASKSPELFVLALKSPVSNYMGKLLIDKGKKGINEWKEKGFILYDSGKGMLRLNYSFYEDSKKLDGYEAAKLIKAPTLIVHGDKDVTVPISQSLKTASLIPSCKLEIIKGEDHRYSNPIHFDKMISLITSFIVLNAQHS